MMLALTGWEIWAHRLLKSLTPLSDTRRKACAVLSLVDSCTKFQAASLRVNSLFSVRIRGRMRTSKPFIEKSNCGLSFE